MQIFTHFLAVHCSEMMNGNEAPDSGFLLFLVLGCYCSVAEENDGAGLRN